MDLGGWDVISALRVDRVNVGLRRFFEGRRPSVTLSRGTLTFGPWQIVHGPGEEGGSNELLALEIPVADGSWEFLGEEYQLAGTKAVVQVNLGILPSTNDRSLRELRFRFDRYDPDAPPDAPAGTVVVRELVVPKGRELPVGAQRALRDELGASLVANRESITYALAELRLAREPMDWLSGLQMRFYFDRRAEVGDSCLVLLGSLGANVPFSALQPGVPPDLVDGDLCVALGPRVVLEHVVKPAMSRGLGLPPGQMRVLGDRMEIEGMLRPMQPGPPPRIRGTARVAGDGLECRLQVQGAMEDRNGHRMDYRMMLRLHNRFSYDAEQQQMTFLPDPHPERQLENGPVHYRGGFWQRFLEDLASLGLAELVNRLMLPPILMQGTAMELSRLRFADVEFPAIRWAPDPDLRLAAVGFEDCLYYRMSDDA